MTGINDGRIFSAAQTPFRSAGVTLIELLVVLVILATLTSFVLIRVSSNAARSPESQLNTFAERAAHYCNRAVLQGRDLGIRVTEEGYDYWEPDQTADFNGATGFDIPDTVWQLSADQQVFTPVLWQADVRIALQLEGRQTNTRSSEQPQIICFASSQVTPFALEVDSFEQRAVLISDSYRNQRLRVR